ncbi:MAG: hypothetical protein ACOY3Z_09985 [Thermodesulfobacteriota bacterium]
MRCPKCSFISFDRQKSCGKCGNELLAVAEQLHGTTRRGEIPFYLGGVLVAAVAGAAALADEEPMLGAAPLLEDEFGDETELDLSIMEEAPESELDLGSLAPLSEEAAEALNLEPMAEEEEAAELDLDLAGAPLEEEEEMPLPPLGLEGLDVSDLLPPMPPQAEPEEEAELDLSLADEPLPPPPPAEEAAPAQLDIELPPLEAEIDLAGEPAAPEPEAPTGEAEEIVDLSLFLEPEEETPAPPPQPPPVDLDLSMADGDQGLSLSLEEEGEVAAPAEEAAKEPLPEIPDLGLTLEMDDDK